MKDAILPRLRGIAAHLETDASVITKCGLRAVEVWDSGHWCFVLMKLIYTPQRSVGHLVDT